MGLINQFFTHPVARNWVRTEVKQRESFQFADVPEIESPNRRMLSLRLVEVVYGEAHHLQLYLTPQYKNSESHDAKWLAFAVPERMQEDESRLHHFLGMQGMYCDFVRVVTVDLQYFTLFQQIICSDPARFDVEAVFLAIKAMAADEEKLFPQFSSLLMGDY